VKLWDQTLTGQIYLGGEAFVKRMQARAELPDVSDVPRTQRRTHSHVLQWYLDRYSRDTVIARAPGGWPHANDIRAIDRLVRVPGEPAGDDA